ncbi:hypothetical protein [Frigoriglobus tundricola]|uniref:Uncharacterized protein n=1 Tax=Frigoriglobus tundricola TaxID=2774151 RepID=A0A6M5YGC7_9BACT|nr:hypothetical protein [Frigoriglobus tundricola]QJW93099.1 hypothetical protein FTUN_0602 [Frigoriglobus tundricola]
MTIAAAAPAPAMPYRVAMLRYGIGEGVERPTKVLPGGGGDLLTPDEIAVWSYVKWLESEVARMKESAEVVTATSNTTAANTSPPMSPDAPNTLGSHPVDASNLVPDNEANTSNSGFSKRKLAEQELLRTPYASNVAIGERLGVSDEWIRRVRKELEAAGRLEPMGTVARRDGTSYTTGTVGVAAARTDGTSESDSTTG